jgi:hypothetical protein
MNKSKCPATQKPGMKRLFWICFLFIITEGAFAQLSLGQVTSNYSGIGGSTVNPAFMANTKLRADINIFSAHNFVENNYFYFPSHQSSLFKMANGAYEFELFPKPYGKGNRYVHTYYNDKSLKNVMLESRIIGPSLMVAVGEHMFAIRTGFRFMSSTRRLPYDMANFSYYTMDFKPQHNTYFVRDNYDMASMAWWEVGFSYAKVLMRGKSNHISAGITVSPLFGYSGAYVTGGDTRYIVYNDDVLNVEQLTGEFGFSLPIDYQTDNINLMHPMVRGYGMGIDLGVSWQYREKPYQKRLPRNCYKKRFEDYKFKLGFSLLDVGWIRFSKNAEKHAFKNVHNNWIDVNQLDYYNISEALEDASELFYGDPDSSLQARSFRIYLPTTVSMQFDYHIKDNWFINSIVAIPAMYASPMIERPVVIALTPRFESRFLEINVPLVLYDFRDPRVGLSIRLDGFTIGTDNIGCFMGSRDITGADIYVSYRIMLRNDGKNPYNSRGACYNNWRYDIKRITHSIF